MIAIITYTVTDGARIVHGVNIDCDMHYWTASGLPKVTARTLTVGDGGHA